MADVFISHAEEDRETAIALASRIEAEGFTTWYYERDSIPGPSYLIQVGREIQACQVLLLIASPSSLRSQHVTNEVIRAYEHAKAFLPLLRGIAHTDIQEQQPVWRQCLGSAVAITIDSAALPVTAQRVLDGLRLLCVRGSSAGDAVAAHVASDNRSVAARQRSNPLDSNLSTISFGDGIVAFRTERFEPRQERQEDGAIQIGAGGRLRALTLAPTAPTEMELAFQLLNQTNHRLSVSGIRVLYFGKIVVVEDCPAAPEETMELHCKSLACAHLSHPDTSKTDLGTLELTFAGDTSVASAETSSLLRSMGVEVLNPHSFRSYLLTLRCSETTRRPVTILRSKVARFVEAVAYNAEATMLYRAASADPFQPVVITEVVKLVREATLRDLDRGTPEPVQVAHVFAIAVSLLADTGDSLNLFSDNIYSLIPVLETPGLSFGLSVSEGALSLHQWLAQSSAQFIQYFINWAIKTHAETLAYHIAAKDGSLPRDLDPATVSPHCYWRDMHSPLRRELPAEGKRDRSCVEAGLAPSLNSSLLEPAVAALCAQGRVQRSNLLRFLANVLTRWPEIGSDLLANLDLFRKADDAVLRNKAEYIWGNLCPGVLSKSTVGEEAQNKSMDSDDSPGVAAG